MAAVLRVLSGLLLLCACGGSGGGGPAATAPPAIGCARTSVGLTPLPDLAGSYQGQAGGLYPGGSNQRPPAHEAVGLARAQAIVPMDPSGQPDPQGRYALLSIGMSNTTQEFQAFMALAQGDATRNPRLVLVDGAQGGQTAAIWANASSACWTVLDARLAAAGVSPQQVAVAWIKLADASPSGGWPAHALALRTEMASLLRLLAARFPRLRLAYFSSRIYAGYATTALNPEPYAYEGAFPIRWLIEDQLNGVTGMRYDGANPIPWLSWGPYLWADGLRPSGQGLTWACSDLAADGTHPSASGQAKVANLLLQFFRSDATARAWYLAR